MLCSYGLLTNIKNPFEVDMQKFRLAASCGVHIIVFMDHLADLISHYENAGHFAELIGLLEQGCNLDRAHQGIYTHLGTIMFTIKNFAMRYLICQI